MSENISWVSQSVGKGKLIMFFFFLGDYTVHVVINLQCRPLQPVINLQCKPPNSPPDLFNDFENW